MSNVVWVLILISGIRPILDEKVGVFCEPKLVNFLPAKSKLLKKMKMNVIKRCNLSTKHPSIGISHIATSSKFIQLIMKEISFDGGSVGTYHFEAILFVSN